MQTIPSPKKQIKPAPDFFIAAYRVALVRDQELPFEQATLSNSAQAWAVVRRLIYLCGQSDREQLGVILLDGKNKIIGLNIVSTGTISSAPAWPRDIVKPAILANASAIILFHNHPSGDVAPSREDEAVTLKVIKACSALDIRVLEHIIVSMLDDGYHSMADHGAIARLYREVPQ
jgi:DNA repair protein RadC